MEIYRIENLTFTYPSRRAPALNGVSLTIESGDFVTLCGPSGCGKTTLLRHLKPSAAPHGVKSGKIYFENTSLEEIGGRDAAAKIGFVMQSPENQIVTDRVWHELAFGLESLGMRTPEIRLRVAEMASFFGIQTWFHKSVTELSGGQKQLLTLASIMALQPSALILDEPTSQLDPIAAGEFIAALGKINRELGVTVILTEHRLEEVFPLSTRAVVLEEGRVLANGSPQEVGLALSGKNHGMFLAMPTPMRVWAAMTDSNEQKITASSCPVTVRDGATWLAEQKIIGAAGRDATPGDPFAAFDKTAVELEDIWFKYDKNLPDTLKGLSFKANFGEITAILGGNGTGKTTALSLIAGLNKPYRGKVQIHSKVCALPQNPGSLFVAKTVREDLLEILSEQKIEENEKLRRLVAMSRLCRLDGLLGNHPYDLSGGEQQRAALAKVLLLQPEILLLDEPTKGFDAEFKQVFAAILRNLTRSGIAVLIASHDIEFCAEHADRCALFFDGSIVTENTPSAFFCGNSFYTTSANRMARGVLPEAITAGDIVLALGGQMPPAMEVILEVLDPEVLEVLDEAIDIDAKYEIDSATARKNNIPVTHPVTQAAADRSRIPKRTIAAMVMILLAIPLTIFIGVYFLDDRKYYFISLFIILQAMLPFALVFESRKPQARELVVIAVLSAIAVAGRAAFFMLPQFKPVIAIVIIAGVAFGGEAGFLVGAMTGFVSNMFFGQGPWTPWQMFAFRIIGYLAGILFRKDLLRRNPVSLAIFGALTTIIVYGGIMNPANVVMYQINPTREMFLAAYIQGLPFDLVHGLATVVFLVLLSRPMLEKLDRIKAKYGLIE